MLEFQFNCDKCHVPYFVALKPEEKWFGAMNAHDREKFLAPFKSNHDRRCAAKIKWPASR